MAIYFTFTILFASSLMHSLQEQKTDLIAFVFLLRSHAVHKGSVLGVGDDENEPLSAQSNKF